MAIQTRYSIPRVLQTQTLNNSVILVKPEHQKGLSEWIQSPAHPVMSAKTNLQNLRQARKRLQYLIQEVEALTQK